MFVIRERFYAHPVVFLPNDKVSQRAKKERLLLKILKNRCHLWVGHTIRHNEFVVNILEGAISGKKALGRPRLNYLKQAARNTAADSFTAVKKWLATIPDGKLPTNQSKY